MSGQSIESVVHDAIHRLTAAEKRAARALLANYPTIGLAPVAEFAAQAGASAATVLRFIAQLGFKSYPDFQRALRDELEERAKSPLQRGGRPAPGGSDHFLDAFMEQTVANLTATAAGIPASEFEAACARLADGKGGCHIIGGRFSDPMAHYLEAYLRIIRSGVRRLDGRTQTRMDQLLDVRSGDIAIIFDVRRYDPELVKTAEWLTAQKAFVILLTDEWISPVSRHAKIVMPCRTGVDRTWDSNSALFALIEAMIARITELGWPTAARRMGQIEQR